LGIGGWGLGVGGWGLGVGGWGLGVGGWGLGVGGLEFVLSLPHLQVGEVHEHKGCGGE